MNEETFLAALHDSPNDEVTWLALADWLEETNQPDRAELVRLVRRLRDVPVMKRTKKRAQLEDRVAALLLAGVRPAVPEIVNSLGMRFALIPPGRFRMGSPEGEEGRDSNEGPTCVAELMRAYYLGVFLITQQQYEAVVGTNPAKWTAGRAGVDTRDFPVENVTWFDAVRFCERLSKLAQEKKARWTYRLPTEAEWEYAARGGSASTGPTCFGRSLSSRQANFDGTLPSWDAEVGPDLGRPCPVGSYPPNAFGLYDMHGNLWEWCQDAWTDYPQVAEGEPTPGEAEDRVTRGGAYFNPARWCRSAARCPGSPDWQGEGIGFRVVLVPPAVQPKRR
jgi:uncharacterized protein (TIGR02996 family)